MRLEPLGEQAVMAYCDDEAAAFALARVAGALRADWLVDVVQAYTSVAVFYDWRRAGFEDVAAALREQAAADGGAAVGDLHVIPCCYELGLDVRRVAEQTGLATDDVIRLHAATEYAVYAIGFCPGFPYLGYLPEALAGVPRLETPRLRVEAGSVGLTGRQTGIYTEVRPGGWNILGRTPLVLVDVADGYFPLRTGDRVRFRRVDEREFVELKGERLGAARETAGR